MCAKLLVPFIIECCEASALRIFSHHFEKLSKTIIGEI